MNFRLKLLACAMAAIPVAAFAIGGPSGPKIDYHVQGHLGEVMMNPYGIAPLTAIVRDGGYTVKDVTVRVLPKPNGREIKYKVSDRQVLTHGGIPVFGLYPDYVNKGRSLLHPGTCAARPKSSPTRSSSTPRPSTLKWPASRWKRKFRTASK